MASIIPRLKKDYPQFSFISAKLPSWSAAKQQITYINGDDEINIWAILHELGHALLGHVDYDTDVSLLRKEIEAWQHALMLADQYHITIDNEHVQDCLDSYRDWLHKRSTCPACDNHGIQRAQTTYGCFNCHTAWRVSSERHCRPYRLVVT